MKPRLTFIHGWGYDSTLWREVTPFLDGYDIELIDLGFFGAPTVITPCSGCRVVVGHSLGVLWWLTQQPAAWDVLVAINGFARFTSTVDFEQGVAPRVLARMQKRFVETPAAVLSDFQTSCGEAGPATTVDTQPLATGLDWLAEYDGRAALQARTPDVWALAATGDPIVPAALTQAAFAGLPQGHLHWLDSTGHLLPLTHARECAAVIREAAA